MLSSHQPPAPPRATPAEAEAERTVAGRGVSTASIAGGMRARGAGLLVVTPEGSDGPVV